MKCVMRFDMDVKDMKTKWTSKIPTKECWVWVKYKGGRGMVICPAEVTIFSDPRLIVIYTARNDVVTEGRLDGMKFGPVIDFPA